jgi:hypothetical protein
LAHLFEGSGRLNQCPGFVCGHHSETQSREDSNRVVTKCFVFRQSRRFFLDEPLSLFQGRLLVGNAVFGAGDIFLLDLDVILHTKDLLL